MDTSEVDKILAGKYPAKAHARKVADYVREKHPEITGGLIYLESQKLVLLEDNDGEAPFRQRRYFYYLTGCDLPDSYVTYDISLDQLILYIPPVDPASVMWSGLPISPKDALNQFDVDLVKYTNPDLTEDLHAFAARSSPQEPIFAIKGQISSPIPQQVVGSLNIDTVKEAINELRVVKDQYEIALIRKANIISTIAHHSVLKNIKSLKNEQEAYAIFTKECISNGAPNQAYHGIFASGRAAATLHYTSNVLPLENKQNILVDAGAEYHSYASDITRTFPISGEFTKESLEIYKIVLEMQKKCIAQTHAGVHWDEVHETAHRVAIHGLLSLGILHNGDAEEIFDARTSVAFFPHGLGHWLGMDTHDTGGNANYSDPDPMFKYLRVRRKLVDGGVITVEPGIYFCEYIIRPYLQDEKHRKYINEEVLDRYWDVGGVRIEDNVVVRDHRNVNLTDTVKEVDDMLRLINGEA